VEQNCRIFNVKPGGKYSNTTVSKLNNVEIYSQRGLRWSFEVLIYSQVRFSCKRELEILGKHQGQSVQSRSEENIPDSYRKWVIGRPCCCSQTMTTYIGTLKKKKKKNLFYFITRAYVGPTKSKSLFCCMANTTFG